MRAKLLIFYTPRPIDINLCLNFPLNKKKEFRLNEEIWHRGILQENILRLLSVNFVSHVFNIEMLISEIKNLP